MKQKKGFTLVELLVVIAIISMLMAILLPAVQSAREAARRTQCLNNIKQLQLAVINYESANQHYPPGAKPSGAVWNAYILPFIEEQAIYDALTLDDPTEADSLSPFGIRQWRMGSANLNKSATLGDPNPVVRNMAAVKQHISLFLCPSSGGVSVGAGQGVASVGPQLKLHPNYVVCGSDRALEDDQSGIVENSTAVLTLSLIHI